MAERTIRVLLVEDNPGDASIILALLHMRDGFLNVSHVTKLSDCLDRLATVGTDVVILDLGLPDSNGLETLVRTRAQAPNLPIIVITTLNDKEIGIRARLEGAQDFYPKDFLDRDLLIRAIQRVTAPPPS